ncbi:MAG: hypothetical protein PF444_02990 [Bacteroidales bacterium]|jgi:hypothetical protein|nr:hypothetical protein [Bacteroidales bacterium]
MDGGIEDGERVNRWLNLGYKFKRTEGVMFHLSHDRGKNSIYHYKRDRELKIAELHRITKMGKSELECEIKNWEWTSDFK